MIEVLLVLIECNFFVEKSTTLFSRLMVMTLKRRKLFRRILWWWEECPIIKTKYSERTRWGNNKYLRAATTVSLCNNQIFFGKKRISSSKRIFTTSKLTKWSPSLFLCYKKVSFQAMHRIRLEYMISCWWYQAQCMFLNTAKWNTQLTYTSLLQTQSKTEQGIFGLWITLRVNRSTVCVCALSDFFGFAHFIVFLMAHRTHCVVAYSILQVFSL